jgi:phage baseplate assembly protein W
MAETTKKITDLDFDFVAHPVSGDIIPLKNGDAIKRAIRNLMFTGYYERVFQPSLGANLKQLLFEPITPMTEMSIRILITDVIQAFEPRAKIINLDVRVSPDENGYNVYLLFAIDQISEVVTVDFFLERLR